MNNPNPLVPQGALPPKVKSTLYIKILMIVALHVVVLGGLLIVGCNPNKTTTAAKPDATADVPKDPMSATPDVTSSPSSPTVPMTPALAPAPSNAVVSSATTPAVTPTTLPPLPGSTPSIVPALSPVSPVSPVAATTSVTPSASGPSTYVIASGDRLSTIAKKNGVTLKALEDANPGVEAKNLQIGHKLNIPAPTAIASTPAAATPGATAMVSDSASATPGDAKTYTVKTGDSLMKIAKTYGTTYKALEALNDMKTSNIKAGQKLKVPVMKVASVDAPSTATPAPVSGTATPMRAN